MSAREAAQATVERLDAVNPLTNADVAHLPDWVCEQANKIYEAIGCGEDPGPLAGYGCRRDNALLIAAASRSTLAKVNTITTISLYMDT